MKKIMVGIFLTALIFFSAAATLFTILLIRQRRFDKERHRLIAKRKFEERELKKPRVPIKAPEPYLWKSED